ncbi:MAG: DsbA family protein [Patescibacteria group bacterium]
MNTKNIIIAVASILGTFILLFAVYKLTNTQTPTVFPEINSIRKDDNVKWKTDSKNIFIEYSDLQCPACRGFYEFFKDLEKTATPNAAFVFRHYPLYQTHPNAFAAAYAAESAKLQGKFWEMESALYEKQAEWSGLQNPKEYYIGLASKLKLDTAKFKQDFESQAVKDRVQVDLSEGEKIGVNATPTFFLNGKKVDFATMDEFKQFLLSL